MRQGSKGSEGAQAPVIFVATEPSFIEQVQEKGFITESGVYRYYGPRNGMISDAITLVGGYMSFITWTLCLQREGGTNNICEKYDILNTFKNRKIKMHFWTGENDAFLRLVDHGDRYSRPIQSKVLFACMQTGPSIRKTLCMAG